MSYETWIRTSPDPDQWKMRILAAVEVDGQTGCWVWTRSRDRYGYGKFSFSENGRPRYMSAHRAAYLSMVGDLGLGMVPDHLCRNRACVNPDHLEATSISVNTLRGDHSGKKGRVGRRPGVVGCGKHGMTDGYTRQLPNGHTRWVCRPCTQARMLRWKAKRAQT